MIILDTNVVSELMRPEPAPQVASWVRDRDRRELRTTTITLAEVRYGIARLPDGRRKQVLLAAADDIFTAFDRPGSAGRHRSRRKLRRHRQQPRASRETHHQLRRADRGRLPLPGRRAGDSQRVRL